MTYHELQVQQRTYLPNHIPLAVVFCDNSLKGGLISLVPHHLIQLRTIPSSLLDRASLSKQTDSEQWPTLRAAATAALSAGLGCQQGPLGRHHLIDRALHN